jgi:hypothetical protein
MLNYKQDRYVYYGSTAMRRLVEPFSLRTSSDLVDGIGAAAEWGTCSIIVRLSSSFVRLSSSFKRLTNSLSRSSVKGDLLPSRFRTCSILWFPFRHLSIMSKFYFHKSYLLTPWWHHYRFRRCCQCSSFARHEKLAEKKKLAIIGDPLLLE